MRFQISASCDLAANANARSSELSWQWKVRRCSLPYVDPGKRLPALGWIEAAGQEVVVAVEPSVLKGVDGGVVCEGEPSGLCAASCSSCGCHPANCVARRVGCQAAQPEKQPQCMVQRGPRQGGRASNVFQARVSPVQSGQRRVQRLSQLNALTQIWEEESEEEEDGRGRFIFCGGSRAVAEVKPKKNNFAEPDTLLQKVFLKQFEGQGVADKLAPLLLVKLLADQSAGKFKRMPVQNRP